MKKQEVRVRWSLMAPSTLEYYKRRPLCYVEVITIIIPIILLSAWLYYLITIPKIHL